MKAIGIIPARYASSRFPGKPLADIGGKPMIQRVAEQSQQALDTVIVATDDARIARVVRNFGGQVIMTDAALPSGTARCQAAARQLEQQGYRFDVVVNIQGDEPFIAPQQIQQLADAFEDDQVQIATLAKPAGPNDTLDNPNRPKVIFNTRNQAIYFSRSPIPFLKGVPMAEWTRAFDYFFHIGLYAYRARALHALAGLPESRLEKAESLEQLRWLDNGWPIHVAVTNYETYAVDSPEDIEQLKAKGFIH